MVKEHSSFVQQATAVVDSLLITGAFYASYLITSRYLADLGPMTQYWAIWAGFLLLYLYLGWTNKLFSVMHFGWMDGLLNRLVLIFSSAGILGASLLYLVPTEFQSRRLYLAFAWISFAVILTEKMAVRSAVATMRRNGKATVPVLLFGRGRGLSQLAARISSSPEWGFGLAGRVDLGVSPAAFRSELENTNAEQVFFQVPREAQKSGFRIDPYLRACEDLNVTGRVFLNLPEATTFAQWQYQRYLERPSMLAYTAELDPDQLLLKRLCDIAGGLAGCVVLMATFPLFAAAIKLSSRGPVFFRQLRVGRNNKTFIIHKYRSMVDDAEAQKEALAGRNRMKGPVFKVKDDPRVTPVGRFLRRFCLDEWPQFVNVLKGDMSLVGTRPPTPDEVAGYGKWHHRRMSIKPGLTGLWQVSGRNRVDEFDEIVRLDLRYIDNWSLWLDITIMMRTVAAVLRPTDAS